MNHEPLEVIDRRTQSADGYPFGQLMESATANVIAEVDRVYDDPVPIFDRILVRQNAAETVWGGTRFVIPESVRQSPNEGVVVATAEFFIVNGKKFPMKDIVKPGDIVKFSKYNAEEVKCDDETFALVNIFDVKFVRKEHYALDQSIHA